MNYIVIKNRKDALKFCWLMLQRFFGGKDSRFPEEVKDLPGNVRRQAQGTVAALGKWMKSPDKHNRARIKKGAKYLQDALEDEDYGSLPDYGLLPPLLASCECATSKHWKQSMIQAGESACDMLAAKCGPGSAGAIEGQCQALDLMEISGCRLGDIVSIYYDDVEEFEEFLKQEEELELAEQTKKRAKRRELTLEPSQLFLF